MVDAPGGRAYPRRISRVATLPRRVLVALLALLALAGAAGCVTASPWTGPAGFRCPVPGPVSFTDDFGAPRGTRTHQGIDIFAPRGQANVAVVAGTVVQEFDATGGGNVVKLTAADGTRYVYMHLDRFQGAPRTVAAGETIGYTGSTGNVRGSPHTHYEVRPDGGAAVNPYAMLASVCTRT
ncbi:MAG TPA: M23 family metallopeptidase [Acidimicrobiia bacterium]